MIIMLTTRSNLRPYEVTVKLIFTLFNVGSVELLRIYFMPRRIKKEVPAPHSLRLEN